jgi:hypothetical protein
MTTMSTLQIVATVISALAALAALAFTIWKFRFDVGGHTAEWFVILREHLKIEDQSRSQSIIAMMFVNKKSTGSVDTTIIFDSKPIHVSFDPDLENNVLPGSSSKHRIKFRVPPKTRVRLVVLTEGINILTPEVVSDNAVYNNSHLQEVSYNELRTKESKKYLLGALTGIIWGVLFSSAYKAIFG